VTADVMRAQRALLMHGSSQTGVCLRCGGSGPRGCEPWRAAADVFTVAGVLPRRLPGLTHPEQVIGERLGLEAPRWLASASAAR
jgi:hypothetical protein